MADPFKAFTEIQTAWVHAYLRLTQDMAQMFSHVFEVQQKFLSHVAKGHRDHIEIASGAALTDKYGKRAHDIDPEKDV